MNGFNAIPIPSYSFKGFVPTRQFLPDSKLGDVFFVEDQHADYVWTGFDWTKLVTPIKIPLSMRVEHAQQMVKDIERQLKDIDGFKEYTAKKIKINYWIKHVLQTFMALCSIGAFIYANISGILSITGDDIGSTIAAYFLVFEIWILISAVISIPVWSKYDV